MDRNNPNREAATDRPARGSKWIWILGAVFLAIIAVILIRGLVYSGTDTNYETSSKGAISDTDRASSGVESDKAGAAANSN